MVLTSYLKLYEDLKSVQIHVDFNIYHLKLFRLIHSKLALDVTIFGGIILC